ncbi:hypothetical protein [Symbioplanes lichenis]|uniref:hypothetical protein n=1 Tax=Symbioplanes lichenis TaxID=1629072 RepID=UPI0027399C1E|nr:hypothetical protein [Actinoplanes lichenis]
MTTDEDAFRRAAQAVADLALTDDMELFDSLHDDVQANFGPPLSMLVDADREPGDLPALIVAARVVEELTAKYRTALPDDLSALIDVMGQARRELAT